MRCLLPARPIRGATLALGLSAISASAMAQAQFDCVIRPSKTVSVAGLSSGVLVSVATGRGDVVRRGDQLAQLDARQEEAALRIFESRAADRSVIAAQEARLSLIEQRAERQAQLRAKGLGTQDDYDAAIAELDVARANLRRAQAEMTLAELELRRAQIAVDLRRVLSPIDGVVVEQKLDAGEYAALDTPIFDIAAVQPLYVEVFAPVAQYHELSLGQIGVVSLRQPAGEQREARITVIDPVSDAGSGSFGLRLEMSNADGRVLAGQRCAVRLPIRDDQVNSDE